MRHLISDTSPAHAAQLEPPRDKKDAAIEASEQMRALIARFGSRRAVIEELDRRKRLNLLRRNDDGSLYENKRYHQKVRNEPNPQWREIHTPSLLIPPTELPPENPPEPQQVQQGRVVERSSDLIFRQPSEIVVMSETTITIYPPGSFDHLKGQPGHCAKCGCPHSDRTSGCNSCRMRHYMRGYPKKKKAA